MTIPSQMCLFEEGCHWFDVGFSPDVFSIDVVPLSLASCFLSILISVEFCVYFLLAAQPSDRYLIAGLTVVLRILPLISICIFLHVTPYISPHLECRIVRAQHSVPLERLCGYTDRSCKKTGKTSLRYKINMVSNLKPTHVVI